MRKRIGSSLMALVLLVSFLINPSCSVKAKSDASYSELSGETQENHTHQPSTEYGDTGEPSSDCGHERNSENNLTMYDIAALLGDKYDEEKSARLMDSTGNAQKLLDYLSDKVGTDYTSNACQGFVWYCINYLFDRSNTKLSCCATRAWQNYGVSSSRDNIPLGATVYFDGSSIIDSYCGQRAGHVGFYVGNGEIIHAWSSKIRKTSIQYVINCGYTYRGWGWQADFPLEDNRAVLDVNWVLDGREEWGRQDFGTVDVYINGSLVADDCNDYSTEWPAGSTYEIRDIRVTDGHNYDGPVYGSNLSGTIGPDTTYVFLSFSTITVSPPDDGSWSPWYTFYPIPPFPDDVEIEEEDSANGSHTEYRYGRWYGNGGASWCKEYGESRNGGVYTTQYTEWSVNRATDMGTGWLCGHFDSEHPAHIGANGTDYRGYPCWEKYDVDGQYYYWEQSRQVDDTVKRWRCRKIIPIPSGEWMRVNKERVAPGEEITFTYGAENATGFYIGIDRDGTRILSQEVPASGFTTSFSETGQYSAYVSISNSTGFVDSNRVSFTVEELHQYLDVNGWLDGSNTGGLLEYGTVDVWINGTCVANDVNDYYADWPIGTSYEIREIRPKDGYSYNGVHSGSLRGTIRSDTPAVTLDFSRISTSNLPEAAKTEIFNGHVYTLYTGPVTWYTAKNLCEAMGGHLVTITSEEENQFVLSLRGDEGVWIGATDSQEEDRWIWVTGESFGYDKWASGEPNDTVNDNEDGEDYAHQVYSDGLWNDTAGCSLYAFICERELELNLSAYLDEHYSQDFEGYGTVDVYINGVLDADDVYDYHKILAPGTTYEIKDIRPKGGCSYNGVYHGTRIGTIGNESSTVHLNFSRIDTSNLPTPAKTESYNGHTYQFFEDTVTWHTARQLCEAMGGHLVTITSAEENELVLNLRGENMIWIGATDSAEEGNWTWITDEPFEYDGWASEEPNDVAGTDEDGEDYAEQLYSSGVWNDGAGCTRCAFVCEIEPDEFELQIRGYLDGEYRSGIGNYGTVDIYVNETLVADNVSEYHATLPRGTSYEVRDICPKSGYSYNGVREGIRKGTLLYGNADVVLNLSRIADITETPSPHTFNGHTYMAFNTPATWYEAEQICKNRGGHLATISSAEENAYVRSICEEELFWIGGTDSGSEGRWRWITGEAFSYENWRDSQPDNSPGYEVSAAHTGEENFMRMYADGTWNDFSGCIKYPFVCEIDSASSDGGQVKVESVSLSPASADNQVVVTASVICPVSNASVYCAVYNSSGKMLSVDMQEATESKTYSFFFNSASVSYTKVFVLDYDLRPLCEAY